MRVFSRWVYPIVLASFVPLWQASALSMEKMCSYWPGTGYIGDSSDCRLWGYCKDNKLTTRGCCNDSLLYDAQSGTCQKAHLVRCAPQHWEQCSKRLLGEYVADLLDCRKYKICDDNGLRDNEDGDGDDELNYCADGYMFSNSLQRCVSSAGGCPQHSLNICAYMQSGTTLGDPLNCGLYLECQSGTGIPRPCSADRYYNYKTGRCQSTRPIHCLSEQDGYRPARFPPPATDGFICANFYQVQNAGVQLISDALTCFGYYVCTSKFDVGRWRSCPQGNHFQWWSGKCVSPETYSCPYDRCGNLNESFVSAINSGCSEYISCINEIANLNSICPEEYPYFDEKRGVCGKDFPNYTVCFMDD